MDGQLSRRQHLRRREDDGLWEIMHGGLVTDGGKDGRVCMMLLICRVVRAPLLEGRLCLLGVLKMRRVRRIDDGAFLLLRFAVGMLSIINGIVSIRIRQRRGHTSALLEPESPGRLPNC